MRDYTVEYTFCTETADTCVVKANDIEEAENQAEAMIETILAEGGYDVDTTSYTIESIKEKI